MKYLCLIYENEKTWETMPPAESEAIMNEYFVFTEASAERQASGRARRCSPPRPPRP